LEVFFYVRRGNCRADVQAARQNENACAGQNAISSGAIYLQGRK
jgi:hypothetical protein